MLSVSDTHVSFTSSHATRTSHLFCVYLLLSFSRIPPAELGVPYKTFRSPYLTPIGPAAVVLHQIESHILQQAGALICLAPYVPDATYHLGT